ncbi:MAG: glutaredoxin family protein [Methanolinea sp.]|nr:glutaredoxin family protein [Methanolinea sp.]
MEMVHVKGRNRGDIRLYALSTCGWCAKTKDLLTTLGVEYRYIFVDLLPQAEMEEVLAEVEKYNPQGSFPTLVIDGSHVIVGFREEEIRKALQ